MHTASRSARWPLCALLGFATPLGAAEPLTGSPLTLGPTVITAVAPQSPLTFTTLPKEARQPVPASDGADYLKTFAGFNAIRNGGSNGDPVLRGQFGSRLNLRTNGGLLLGACPGRMDAPSAYIAPETFDTLTVIKGPQSVLWGPGASAGTVLFEREREAFEQSGSRLAGSVLAGSNGRFDRVLDGALGGPEGYLRLVGNQAQADDYRDGAGQPVPSRWRKWNGDLALGWAPAPDTLLELSAGKGNGEARYGARGMDGSRFARDSFGLRAEQGFSGGLLHTLEGQLYYNYAHHVMDNFRLRNTPPGAYPRASEVDRRTSGGRLAATFEGEHWQLVAGMDALRSEHRRRASAYNPVSGAYTGSGHFPWLHDATMHNYGAFAESTWHASPQGRIVSGVRLDHADTTDYRPTAGAGQRRASTLPSGFARYEHDLGSATLYAGLGHVQRFPDYWELFSARRGPDGTANAFSGVQPEKTTQLDAGAQYRGEHLEAWVSAYAGVVRDFILFSYNPGSQARNVDAHIWGGELGASYRFTEQVNGDATLAYAWGRNSTDHRALAQQPPLEARLGLHYSRERWSSGVLWRLVAAQHRVAVGSGNVVGQDFGPSAGFGVLSANAAYRVDRHWKLSAGVDNLLGKRYTEHLNLAGNAAFGYPAGTPLNEPGRTLWSKGGLHLLNPFAVITKRPSACPLP
ncbi:TonB-dependent copper receptor [Pseudomonas sp. NPDC007930]|uniref:TonB-dependent copper receptor n=1 Tax=Pseudomonas sp. NPDC007930 TaxID=3364417 RepID=UPI0036EEC75E